MVSKINKVDSNCFQIQIENNETLKIHKLTPEAIIPIKATSESIGYDLYAISNTIIPINDNQLIDTGLAMKPPDGTYIRIAPRSGLAVNQKIQVDAGVIDPDYTGEIKVLLFNKNKQTFQVNAGDKIAQFIIENAETVTLISTYSH